ncbi:MAG TPA: tripartite tricarboxylate transporter substrate binding protein [Syntrophorhabdaceae bacterium]|nr:tripartite tricarboxylate transporter substrate binding protein [Syntrophorhabdaceae bacterium]
MRTKQVLRGILLFVVALVLSVPSMSFAAYPDKNIQLVIPYVAGATGDITARLVANELEKILGVKIIPVNKPGASTVLGVETVAKGKKDGYTLLYAGNTATVYVPATDPGIIHFDPVKDLEPLGFHYIYPQGIAVKADAPWNTFAQFIDYAKKNPGKIRVSTIGVGSSPHFALEMIQSITGTQMTHVPFEGGESTVTAVMGGHVEAACDGLAKFKPHVEAKKMKILLLSNKMPDLPGIPTITELGYKQKLYPSCFAVHAPGGIPEDVKKVLVPAVEKAIKATFPKITAMGSLPEYHSPAEMREMREDEYKVVSELAIKLGLRKAAK